MTGQAERVKRKRLQMRQGWQPAHITTGSWTGLPWPWQLSSSASKARRCRKSQAGSASVFCSAALIWDTPEQRAASGSTVLTCQNSGSIFISAPAWPLQLGWASLISGLAARIPGLTSSNSELRRRLGTSFWITRSTASWGVSPGSQGCGVIAAAAIEIHFWISVPWAESSESSQGEGSRLCILQAWAILKIPKASFLCGLFQNLLKVPGDLFLDNFFSLAWGRARRELNRCQIWSFSNSTAWPPAC